MNPLVDELIRILQKHPAVKSVRIVNYDETPAGKLEVKIRARLIRSYHESVRQSGKWKKVLMKKLQTEHSGCINR